MHTPVPVLACALAAAACVTSAVIAGGRENQSASAVRVSMIGPQPAQVARYAKFEASFTVAGISATALQWPYDTNPPNGIPAGTGVTVNGVFTDPGGRQYTQPAFLYQRFEDDVRDGRDWHYPTSQFMWKVRFTPNRAGEWKYRVVVQDRAGRAETAWSTFAVTPSSNRGFIRVSEADRRYFEFEDGTLFTGLGFQLPEYLDDPVTRGGPAYQQLAAAGVNFVRLWISSLYGSAWTPYVGGRNRYNGYLPLAGLTPFRDDASAKTTLAMRLDYEPTGDAGWFDACRLEWANNPTAVKPNTRYRVRATYRGRDISGPRSPKSPNYGLVVKIGGMFPNCYEPGTSRAITTYGRSNTEWQRIEGTWSSGPRSFMPKLHLALENVTRGAAFLEAVSVRELLPDGSEGPEVLPRPSMAFETYVPQARAYALDRIVELAERNGVYLKLVAMEKGDEVYLKLDDNGEFVTSQDNQDGFYGTGRVVNRTRWLQQAWWRYLQARWGYSPSIHSWELVNEGDPASTRHYELADEFGKFMHYRVFGVDPSPSFNHPNDHLVTTSFWHSFPAAAFWANAAYPNVDYADLHAYVSTTTAPGPEKERMKWDSAHYHTWHSQFVAAAKVGKPVVRGEAGLDVPGRQDEAALGIQRDRTGTWLHNFLWSGLDSGGLYELYWWRSHIWNNQADHRRTYRLVNQFLSTLDLNKGGYVDWNGTVSNPAVRVVGQKNPRTGNMHLWIQNAGHTWRNVVDGKPIAPASADISVPGFRASATYQVEWWDTYALEKTTRAADVTADASGALKLSVTALDKDVAISLRPAGAAKQAVLQEE